MSLFVLGGFISSSALNAVLLLIAALQHPSFFLAAAVCTVSNCFTSSAFPSHTSPEYSINSFGTINIRPETCLDRMCQGASLLGWHPSCLRVIYALLLLLLYVYPTSSLLISLRQGYVYWCTIGSSSSPHFELKFTACTSFSLLTTTAHFSAFAVTLHFLVVFSICFCSRVFLISPRSHPQTSIPALYLPLP